MCYVIPLCEYMAYKTVILVRIGTCLQGSQRFATNIRIKALCIWCSSRRTWFQATRINCYWSRNRKRSSWFGCSTNIMISRHPPTPVFYSILKILFLIPINIFLYTKKIIKLFFIHLECKYEMDSASGALINYFYFRHRRIFDEFSPIWGLFDILAPK